MGKPKSSRVVLSVAPATRGMAYAIFEKETEPIDWGIKTARINKNRKCEGYVESLISFYQPDVLVLERLEDNHRRERADQLLTTIEKLAVFKGVEVVRVSRDDVKTVFGQFGGSTKQSIAKTITLWFPELKHRMPRYRKPWLPEAHSMVLFECFALGLTYYYQTN